MKPGLPEYLLSLPTLRLIGLHHQEWAPGRWRINPADTYAWTQRRTEISNALDDRAPIDPMDTLLGG